jgi:hypothetical protein
MGVCIPIPTINHTSQRITVRCEEKKAGKDPQKRGNTNMSKLNDIKVQFEKDVYNGVFKKENLDALSSCEDIAPGGLCRALFVSSGSTFKQAIESIRRGDLIFIPGSLLLTFEPYTKAFALLGPGWESTSDTQRLTLLHIVEDQKFRNPARNQRDFLPSKTFEKEIMPLFHGFDSQQIVACLNEIRSVRKAMAGEPGSMGAVAAA